MAKSWFETLTDYAHDAGKLVRDTAAGVQEAYKDLAPTITKALEVARSIKDGEGLAQVKQIVDSYSQRVLSDGSTALGSLRQQVQVLVEAANGAPPVVAGRLAAYTIVQKAATDKSALELAEVKACQAHLEKIRVAVAAYKADPKSDITECTRLGDEFDTLMETASKEIETFDADEQTVRRKVANTGLAITEIGTAEKARAAAEKTYLETIKGSTALPATDGLATVDSLSARVTEAEADVAAGNFPAAAVKLHNWDVAANAVLDDKRDHTKKLERATRVPNQKKSMLNVLLSSYEEKQGPVKGDFAKLFLEANTAVKARPYDAADAEAKLDRFEQAVRPFISDASKASE